MSVHPGFFRSEIVMHLVTKRERFVKNILCPVAGSSLISFCLTLGYSALLLMLATPLVSPFQQTPQKSQTNRTACDMNLLGSLTVFFTLASVHLYLPIKFCPRTRSRGLEAVLKSPFAFLRNARPGSRACIHLNLKATESFESLRSLPLGPRLICEDASNQRGNLRDQRCAPIYSEHGERILCWYQRNCVSCCIKARSASKQKNAQCHDGLVHPRGTAFGIFSTKQRSGSFLAPLKSDQLKLLRTRFLDIGL